MLKRVKGTLLGLNLLMTVPAYCPHCGVTLPPGAQFCPNCGQAVSLSGDRAIVVAPEPERARPWWLIAIPLGILAVGLITWAILSGMPFGGPQQVQTLSGADTSNTIGESAQTTETVSQIGGTTTTNAGPVVMPQPLPETTTTQPPAMLPAIVETPPATTTAMPQQPAPPPMASSAPTPSEISEDDALGRLRDFLSTNNPYSTGTDCLGLRSLGYRNHGYTIDVRDTCQSPPASLGRWRVDAVNGEVYRPSS